MAKRAVHPPEIVTLGAAQAKALLAAHDRGATELRTTRTLGLDFERASLSAEGIRFEGAPLIGWEVLRSIGEDDRRAYRFEGGQPTPIQAYSDQVGALRTLCPSAGAPTTLIGGIPMHRIKDADPWQDSQAKVATLKEPKGRVLDTCFGLGYAAILLGRRAKEVTSFEIDPNALAIARLNPWSLEAFQSPKITVHCADAAKEVAALPTGRFEAVMHDPPTLALAGELYSLEFYRELHRVMRRGAVLFHYIGDPESRIGMRVYPGVMRRLAEAGFRSARRELTAQGVSALA